MTNEYSVGRRIEAVYDVATATSYFHRTDANKNVIALTNASGLKAWYEYSPFANHNISFTMGNMKMKIVSLILLSLFAVLIVIVYHQCIIKEHDMSLSNNMLPIRNQDCSTTNKSKKSGLYNGIALYEFPNEQNDINRDINLDLWNIPLDEKRDIYMHDNILFALFAIDDIANRFLSFNQNKCISLSFSQKSFDHKQEEKIIEILGVRYPKSQFVLIDYPINIGNSSNTPIIYIGDIIHSYENKEKKTMVVKIDNGNNDDVDINGTWGYLFIKSKENTDYILKSVRRFRL